jgi:hypothetical protein
MRLLCSIAPVSRIFLMVAHAATGPSRSVWYVVEMKLWDAGSMTSRLPITAAMAAAHVGGAHVQK